MLFKVNKYNKIWYNNYTISQMYMRNDRVEEIMAAMESQLTPQPAETVDSEETETQRLVIKSEAQSVLNLSGENVEDVANAAFRICTECEQGNSATPAQPSAEDVANASALLRKAEGALSILHSRLMGRGYPSEKERRDQLLSQLQQKRAGIQEQFSWIRKDAKKAA